MTESHPFLVTGISKVVVLDTGSSSGSLLVSVTQTFFRKLLPIPMIMSLDLDHRALRDETASLGIPKSPTTRIAPGLDIGGVKKMFPSSTPRAENSEKTREGGLA